MNSDNTLKLSQSFPRLYPGTDPLSSKNAPFSFWCGDGWFEIIWELSEKISAEIPDATAPPVIQVKEKFGTLRYYMSIHSVAINAAISEAEARSAITCEICGQPGNLRGQSWLYTLCDEHDSQRIIEKRGI